MFQPYQSYSFEELRYMSPPVKRSIENMLIRPNCDGTYSATWTPASVGYYSIIVTIDGYHMEEVGRKFYIMHLHYCFFFDVFIER